MSCHSSMHLWWGAVGAAEVQAGVGAAFWGFPCVAEDQSGSARWLQCQVLVGTTVLPEMLVHARSTSRGWELALEAGGCCSPPPSYSPAANPLDCHSTRLKRKTQISCEITWLGRVLGWHCQGCSRVRWPGRLTSLGTQPKLCKDCADK